jgi:mediator of RNA polymerase II transcription subunit 10
VLFTDELEISGDKNKHATSRTRKLAINGGDEMLTLLERKSNKFSNDILKSY